MRSKLVSKLNDINHELAISRYARIDAQRLHYLERRKAQLLRDISSLGFSDAEIQANDIATGDPNKKEVGSKSLSRFSTCETKLMA
jgi:hypothetical protein